MSSHTITTIIHINFIFNVLRINFVNFKHCSLHFTIGKYNTCILLQFYVSRAFSDKCLVMYEIVCIMKVFKCGNMSTVFKNAYGYLLSSKAITCTLQKKDLTRCVEVLPISVFQKTEEFLITYTPQVSKDAFNLL